MTRLAWLSVFSLVTCRLSLFSLCTVARAQDDFQFSWEKNAEGEEKQDVAAPAPEPEGEGAGTAAAPVEKKAFQWTGGTEEAEGVASEVGTEEAVAAPAAVADSQAYDEMLKENQELKRKIAEASKAEESVRKENERLSADIKDMERRNAQFATLIRDLQEQKKDSADNPDQVKELEAKLQAVEQEKTKLGSELTQLRKTVAARAKAKEPEAVASAKPATPPTAEPAAPQPAGTATVKPGSDLFRDKEKENLALKDKLVDIEEARRKAIKERDDILKKAEKAQQEAKLAGEKQKEMEAKLAAAAAAQKETTRTIEKLMEQIPALEKELTTLKSNTSKQGSTERNLQSMEVELQKREQRLIKAERMTAVLEKARDEVAQVSERERRDMHYNMAVVYSKEGRLREAEAEYLRALQIDPNDPAVHYNLGILYDDELNEKDKAAMHYRKYLKLSPHGSDVDAVKGWLLKIEMGQ